MSVGCLGGGSASNNGGLPNPMDVIAKKNALTIDFLSFPFLRLTKPILPNCQVPNDFFWHI
jgi:hypothetical protein